MFSNQEGKRKKCYNMKKFYFYSHNKVKHPVLLVSFLTLIIAVWFSVFIGHSNSVIFPIWVLWSGYILLSTNTLNKNEQTFVKTSVLFLVFEMFYLVIGYSSMGVELIVQEINWIMSGIVAVYALSFFSGRELTVAYKTMALALFVLLVIFLTIGRSMMTLYDQDTAAATANAWYGSVYMLVSGLSLVFFLNVKSFWSRLISILLLALTLYFNFFVMQRGTNVIFTVVEIGMILVFTIKRKPVIILLSIVFGLFVFFALNTDFLIDLFTWLSNRIPSERLSRRFNDIAIALAYSDIEATDGSFQARSVLMNNSWNSFTSSVGHFLFGVGEHKGSNSIIGHHSFFLDTLARYGIIGGAIVFVYFKKQYQIIMSELDKKLDWALYMQCAVIFLIYVLRNFYGQVAYALVNFLLLFFFPLTFQIIRYYKRN